MSYSDDMWAIHQLHARFCATRDGNLHEEWTALFTEDGSFEIPVAGKRSGHEDLLAFSKVLAGPDDVTPKHYVSNIHVLLDGDEATGTAYFQYFTIRGGIPKLGGLGVYTDRFRKVDGQWLIVERVGTTDTDVSLI